MDSSAAADRTVSGDPRSIVTPDAFSVSPDLLGTPLAQPWRRFAALMVDLVLVGFVQLLGWRVLGGLVALTLFRLATRRPEGASSGPARKVALGCAGTVVLIVGIGATILPSVLRHANDPGAPFNLQMDEDGAVVGDSGAEDGVEIDLGDLVAAALANADATDSATTAEDSIARLNGELAAVRLENTVLDNRIDAVSEELEETRQQLDEAGPSTLFSWIRDAADEAGLVMGWGTIYLTLFLALWGGRTPGKKLLGLRVVRLNGQPLGLFMSLERAGGYAAGLATGLLGFAQVWWDPNRQAIHDKIAETVVVREGLPRVAYERGAYEDKPAGARDNGSARRGRDRKELGE